VSDTPEDLPEGAIMEPHPRYPQVHQGVDYGDESGEDSSEEGGNQD